MDRTIEIDDALVKAALDKTGEADERVAVETVLRDATAAKSPLQSMFDLVGQVTIREDYDYKAMRAGDGVPD